jgi:outer membrane protein TolC
MRVSHRWKPLAAALLYLSAGSTQVVGQGVTDGETISLQRAIQLALSNSHLIMAAEEGLNAADQQVREAWADVYPDFSVNASYARNLKVQEAFLPARLLDPSAPEGAVTAVRFGSDNTWIAGFDFSQPLFDFNMFIGVGAAGRFRSLEVERVRGTTQQVVTAVRQAYLLALLAMEDLRLTENSLARTRATLEETQALNRAGLASSYDVLRLEVQVANLEPNVRRAQNSVAAAKRQLLVEIGLEPTGEFELEGRLNEMDVSGTVQNNAANELLLAVSGLDRQADFQIDELHNMAMGRRSDVAQGRLVIILEETRMRAQKAEYFPTVSLFGNYAITAQEDRGPTFFGDSNQRTTASAAGLRISLPVFQGFRRDAQVQRTAATVRQYEAQLERLGREVESQLRTVLDNLEESRLRMESQRRAVAQAGRGFEIASTEYREGVGSQLQITDAENALRQSEFNYAQAVFDHLMAWIELDATLGTVPVAAGELVARVNDRGES